jgi:hypothetical protein
MLNTLFQNILSLLKEEFSEFGLTGSNYGLLPFSGSFPYVTITGEAFNLKKNLLKNKEGIKKLSLSETFMVPSSTAGKKGPYLLRAPVSEMESLLVIKKPGTDQEEVQSLDNSKYTINEKVVNLTDDYAGGTKLIISYKSLGEEFNDRFELLFILKIYEQDPIKLEKYSLLSISAIWGNMHSLIEHTYQYGTGTIMAEINLSELAFIGQTADVVDPSVSNLHFKITGIANFAKTRPDGYYEIERIELGENNTVSKDAEGVAIGFNKNKE